MKIDKSRLRRYYRKISSSLPYSTKRKYEIMNQLKGGINSYTQNNPDSDFEELEKHFGTAEEIAESCIAQIPAEKIVSRTKIGARIIAIILILIIFFGVTWWVASQIIERNSQASAVYVLDYNYSDSTESQDTNT